MRNRFLPVVLAAITLVMLSGVFTSASAGSFEQTPNSVVVDKVVEGPVPAGTVFEVEVDCQNLGGNGDMNAAPSANGPLTLKFDANGDPLDSNTVSVAPLETCTVTETVTGGAMVSYACEIVGPVNGAHPGALLDASCVDDQTVEFGEVFGAEATVTVTNTFESEPEPAPEPEAAPDTAARQPGVVAARPTFTG